MNFAGLIQEAFKIAGTYDLKLVVFLFLICAIGEFGLISIPYLLETIWLSSGYNFSIGVLNPYHLVFLWLVAQVARQTGAIILFYCGRFGSVPFVKLYQKYIKARLSKKLSNQSSPFKFFKMNVLSPFSVAAGRLLGLRIPLSLAVGANRQLRTNILGILLASLIWDSIYIVLGIFGGRIQLKPSQMMLYSLVGLTAIYVVTLTVRYLRQRSTRSKDSITGSAKESDGKQ
jgi:membrane protein DedA with SNARE-associated domain